MIYFLSKILLHGRCNMNIVASNSQTMKILCNLQKNPSIFLSLRSFSSLTTSNQPSFVVSYLINKCGLSPESALLASKRVKFETPNRPDSVIAFLKNHGFSETQITTLVRKWPIVLTFDVEKTLSPKVEFFYSKGVLASDLTALISKCPKILWVSLDKQIIPYFNLLRNFLLSDENVFKSLKLFPRIFCYNIHAYVMPNINALRNSGVPEHNIVKILNWHPQILAQPAVLFKENVEKVKELGLNPENFTYVIAVYALGSINKAAMEKKLNALKKYGWSEEDISTALKGNPSMMKSSEDKLIAMMDFLVNKMGFKASVIAKRPRILTLSVENRLVPRGLFAQDLVSKGLLKNGFQLSKLFESSEKKFLDMFVYCHEEKASELLKLYEEKINLSVGRKNKIQKS